MANTDTGEAAKVGVTGAVLGQAGLEDQQGREEEPEHALGTREINQIINSGEMGEIIKKLETGESGNV